MLYVTFPNNLESVTQIIVQADGVKYTVDATGPVRNRTHLANLSKSTQNEKEKTFVAAKSDDLEWLWKPVIEDLLSVSGGHVCLVSASELTDNPRSLLSGTFVHETPHLRKIYVIFCICALEIRYLSHLLVKSSSTKVKRICVVSSSFDISERVFYLLISLFQWRGELLFSKKDPIRSTKSLILIYYFACPFLARICRKAYDHWDEIIFPGLFNELIIGCLNAAEEVLAKSSKEVLEYFNQAVRARDSISIRNAALLSVSRNGYSLNFVIYPPGQNATPRGINSSAALLVLTDSNLDVGTDSIIFISWKHYF